MNSSDNFVLISIHLPSPDDSGRGIDDVIELLDIDPSAIDHSFGLVSISPVENLYAVMIESASLKRVSPDNFTRGIVSGEYADPKIEHFGLPSSSEDSESNNSDENTECQPEKEGSNHMQPDSPSDK